MPSLTVQELIEQLQKLIAGGEVSPDDPVVVDRGVSQITSAERGNVGTDCLFSNRGVVLR